MLIPLEVKIYLYTPATDMRKSIDTLCVLISDVLKMNPAEGHLFLFRCKRGNKLKAIYYEQNCFTLWYRRLEKGKFVFPKNAQGAIELTAEHFNWLLASDKYSRMDAMIAQEYESFI
ncbi:MAG TPA: IS66 family insertion sequence element accessory protein TnpB [Gammaproteobacteria bacterium]|nr:IS66 family insertion sequence element accessory protein TnpB [Gammaproteobacteria bacterium]